jgi:hypothetical protein
VKSTQQKGLQRLSGVMAALAVGLFLNGVVAQGNVEKGKAKTNQKAEAKVSPKPPAAVVPTAKATGVTFARVEAESVKVRCFASINSPMYEEAFPKGTVLSVGEAVGEFRRVQIPMGVVGYVSKKFATAPAKGMVHTTGNKVSFRYRPTPSRRAEQPVTRLKDGTELMYLGEQGDWWKVRMNTEAAYLAIKDIQVFQTANVTLEKSHAALLHKHQTEWQGAAKAYETAAGLVALNKVRSETLEGLRTSYVAELKKPLDTQELGSVMAGITALGADLPKGEPLMTAVQALERAVKTQQVILDARALLATTPLAAKMPVVKVIKTPGDPLARLQHLGWLRHSPNSTGPTAYHLSKGGRIVCYVKCSTERYDLSMFDGVEVGVIGTGNAADSSSYVDVSEIVVLGHSQ